MITKISGIRAAALSAALIIIMAMATPLSAEFIFLKTGEILEGSIVNDKAATVFLRTADKKTLQIKRDSIMRILYTKLKMGKIYIQKRNGEGIVAFIVDEDQENYIFRKELYKPQEFNLKRSEVLFMAEKNPSGLAVSGEIGTDRVSLVWLPPYDAVKKYNIYIKKNREDKYEPAESVKDKKAVLKKLSSNTKYYLIVTSVDSQDYESEPSNELVITTKNIAPSKPGGITREMKGDSVTVRWKESTDPDGFLKGYNIYRIDGKERVRLASVKKPEYSVPGDISVFKLEITAEDDLGSESPKSRVLMPLQLAVMACPAVFSLTGELGEKFNPGTGGTLNIGLRNTMFQNMEAGISCGYFTFKGKDKENTESMSLIPFSAYGGYHFRFMETFTFFPFAKLGGSCLKMKYTSIEGNTDKTVTDPAAAFGVSLTAEYGRFNISTGADCGLLYESKGSRPFYECFINIGTLFEL